MSLVMVRLIAPVQVKVPPGERRQWKAAARRRALTLSEFVRLVVRDQLIVDRVAGVPASDPPPGLTPRK